MPAEEAPPGLLRYGPHPAQTVEYQDACSGPARGLAVLVHGGYWRARHTASLMVPLARDLVAHGWAAANIEYRSNGNGGGWPGTFEDTEAAIDAIRRSDWGRRQAGPVVGIGHSVGGQLVLLNAARLDAAVALAPVTDIERTYQERLGEDAAAEFFGAGPDRRPDDYAAASPIRRLPLDIPALIVHGATDARVPLRHSEAYVSQARRAGDHPDFHCLNELDHLAAIDPSAPHWNDVRSWLDSTAAQSILS
ncbi:alpha/beta hydrolase [Arthrobacter ginkgonis]|uniref:Alpha/beta hydrolase n=1 Tax=Arthrobacter ginkgonis TaxID=1630594 RepID=A0ABP7BVB1_9MICC